MFKFKFALIFTAIAISSVIASPSPQTDDPILCKSSSSLSFGYLVYY